MHTATYSPDDNKLRIYPESRLDRDTYDRARACGFRWAPRQELFVAPCWTPAAEDFALELCGEIGDEDKTLTERADERADRFTDYSDNRAKDADQARKAVSAIADNIPLGQPILVGHHSERHARRDAAKIENGMRRAVKMWETSKYWQDRAAGAIRHAKYKELPSVRARRIKRIEADKRAQERTARHARLVLKFWRGELMAKKKGSEVSEPLEVTRKSALWFCNGYDQVSRCFTLAEFPRTNEASTYEGQMSLWSALGGNIDGKDPETVAIVSVEQAKAISTAAHERTLARCERWIAHYDNRLSYERAMLAESGGTVTDRKGPEKNGACKCWASPRGGWSYIKKVNQVSVTVEDNWGNGGANFTRTIPFDKLGGVMTAAEVEQARTDGNLRELDNKTGFCLVSDFKPKPPAPEPERVQTVTDVEAKAQFQAMKETIAAGGVQVVSAPQLFPTPVELCERMADLAELCAGDRVLEPSAGTGNLLSAIIGRGIFRSDCVAVEINHELFRMLANKFEGARVDCADFMAITGESHIGKFDKILMNPPFQNADDIRHIERARAMLNPGGKLVAICANGPRQNEKLRPLADFWEVLPAGTFNGTGVSAVLLTISAPVDEHTEANGTHWRQDWKPSGIEGLSQLQWSKDKPATQQTELF